MAIGYKSGGGYAAPRYESAPAPAPAPARLPYRTEVQYPVDYGYPDEQYADDYAEDEYRVSNAPSSGGNQLPPGYGLYEDGTLAPYSRREPEANAVQYAPYTAMGGLPVGYGQYEDLSVGRRPGGYADRSEWNRGFYDAVKARATQWMDDPSVQNWIARRRLHDMP